MDDSHRSIINLVAVLAKPVPMKTRRLIAQIVIYMSYEPVAFGNVHLRRRELAINANHRSGKPIRRGSDPINTPMVFHCLRNCYLAEAKQYGCECEHGRSRV